MEKIKSRIKGVLRIFWEYKYSIVAAMLIVSIALSGVHYLKSGDVAIANVSLNYSEASSGLNPNGTRFNSYEIYSTEVLDNAIELAGLQGTIDAQSLTARVNVSPVDTGNSSGDDNYITTTYSISLDTSELDIKNRSTSSLLENICSAYKSYFLESYGDDQTILKLKLELSEDCEPYLRLNDIKLRADQIERYLAARMKQSRAFIDEETGESFDGFEKRLMNIQSYDIPNATAYIIERGVASSPDTLVEILAYKNKIEAISADKQMAYYEADNGGIMMYEKLMSSIVMIPTMDEQEQYYMSRTKTAMDNLARNADSELAEATSYKKEIVNTSYVIERMQTLRSQGAELEFARELINKLELGLNELSQELLSFDKSYIEYKAQNYITFNYYEQSFLQRIDLKKTISEVAALCCVLALIIYAKTARKEKNGHEKV